MFGKPVIRGTRVPVEHILRKLALGEGMADVRAAYPHLEEADVRAALAFADESARYLRLRTEEVHHAVLARG